ncbi:hypothetical protein ADICEAN_04245 [Cesiribacter andamanensis AMV16]|uniref:Uncharacterized protein n=1 Tax=Cesiribacter andamanensis AMV16 TaxID=1279009 RepID=M7MW11_9BACT|nr:hypothetical protein ADICEAN_04245 [Cesiribacter andamanensis AMV16]
MQVFKLEVTGQYCYQLCNQELNDSGLHNPTS